MLLHSALCVRILLNVGACLSFVLAMSLAGCTTWEHGRSASEFAARSLSTDSAEGRQRLESEAEYDRSVRELIDRRGRPQYLYVVDRDHLYLYYTESDWVAVVERMMIPPGKTQIFERIPGFLLKLLPAQEVASVRAEREEKSRAARAAKAREAKDTPRASSQRNTSPAARAPSAAETGVRFSDFDPQKIVQRLSTPLSAADPGVSGWRLGTFRDGKTARIAKFGGDHFQVHPDAVIAMSPIRSDGRNTPSSAKFSFSRVNHAVFGTRAEDVNQHVSPLLSQVSSDTSGRTRVVRRVAGRTVSITRDPKRGLLIYSVHSH